MEEHREIMRQLNPYIQVTTIAAAVKTWRNKDLPMHAQLCRQMVEWIADPENQVCGNAGEYHALVNAANDSHDYYAALRIAQLGLEHYPYNMDLLANAMRVAGESGDFEQGENFLARLENVGRSYWDWSAYLYATDLLEAEMACACGQQREQLIERMLKMSDDFVAAFPALDRAYNTKAEALILLNRKDQAERVLKEAIFNGSRAGERPILAPQCCLTYLEKLLSESNAYDTITKVAMQGLVATATNVNSANFGYFVYRIALAKDAQVVAAGFDNKDKVLEALNWYQNAFDCFSGSAEYIAKRYLFIRQNSMNPIDRPLIDHPLALSDPEKIRQKALSLAAQSANAQSEREESI